MTKRMLRIIEHKKKRVQLTTSPDMAVSLEEFLGIEITTTLSRAALEALAIIAYKQPITRTPDRGSKRGDSDGVVRNLLSKGLIQELGRAETLGKPFYMALQKIFFTLFWLTIAGDLPDVEKEVLIGGKLEQNILKQ
jgi:segregation and condensation protein B